MPSRNVRNDVQGSYIVLDGQRYRSGPLYMPRPAMRHDDGGLTKGDRATFRRIPCAPAIIVTTRDGGETVWETEDCKRSLALRDAAAPAGPGALAAILGGHVLNHVTRIEP